MIKELIAVGLTAISLSAPITTQNVAYDDTQYQITLSTEEINHYTFKNTYNYLYSNGLFNRISLTYNNSNYPYSYNSGSQYVYEISANQIRLGGNNYNYSFRYYIYSSGGGGWVNRDFTYQLTINLDNNLYNDFKRNLDKDINENNPKSMFDSIYDYFHDTIFSSDKLDDYSTELMGENTSMRHYLSLTASIIFIVLIVVFAVGFIIMLVKFIANMLINLGGR